MFRLERVRVARGVTSVEVAYGITGLPRDRAGIARLRELARGHWGIESRLFGVRDDLLGGDACRVRTGAAPPALAALRNVAVCLLSGATAASRAAATRQLAARPQEAVAPLNT